MDAHDAVFTFHQDIVKVPDSERERLARARERNVERVLTGLDELGLPRPIRVRSQGGYAMHTLAQREDGDQDIDVALVSDARDVPSAPSAARQNVLDAVLEVSPPFAREPERRTNAVTVWYSGGYHVDFAVYRQTPSGIEHAGSRWRPSNSSAIVNWFTAFTRRVSPTWHRGDRVRDSQFRRVVRMMKFLRQNDEGSHLGGYFVTALAAQSYVAAKDGDDLALLKTMRRAASQLAAGSVIRDPLRPRNPLHLRPTDQARLRRYLALLKTTLGPLHRVERHNRESGAVLDAWQTALGFDL